MKQFGRTMLTVMGLLMSARSATNANVLWICCCRAIHRSQGERPVCERFWLLGVPDLDRMFERVCNDNGDIRANNPVPVLRRQCQ